MEVGIVGMLGVGKTTLFQALTGVAPPLGGAGKGGAGAPNVGIARVPDPRLQTIASFITTKQIIPATIRVVDIPGFATGGEASAFARQVLAHIREVDAVCHVVRCFKGLGTDPAPGKDIDDLEMEMVFADLSVVEQAKDKAARSAKSGDKDAKARLAALDKAYPILSEGKPIRSISEALSEEEKAALRGYGMITLKPVLYVANIEEGDLAAGPQSPLAKVVDGAAKAAGGESVALCAKLEAEIAELAEADRAEMLSSLGLTEPALSVMARALYHRLGLTSFYTAGEKEVRAWPIPFKSPAPKAAGVIHSDIERGFIRAECYHVDDLVRYKSEKAVKDAGKLRSEGKNYAMQDGDVVHFLFNV